MKCVMYLICAVVCFTSVNVGAMDLDQVEDSDLLHGSSSSTFGTRVENKQDQLPVWLQGNFTALSVLANSSIWLQDGEQEASPRSAHSLEKKESSLKEQEPQLAKRRKFHPGTLSADDGFFPDCAAQIPERILDAMKTASNREEALVIYIQWKNNSSYAKWLDDKEGDDAS